MNPCRRKRHPQRRERPFGGFVFPKRKWRDRLSARGDHRQVPWRAHFKKRSKPYFPTKGHMVMSQKKIMQLVGAVDRPGSDGKKTWWTRIGVAFQNRDGSYNLPFDYLPLLAGSTIQMREMDAGEAPPTQVPPTE
jgi:hypothetical protein